MPERGGWRPLPVCIRAQKLGPSHLLGKSRRPCGHAAGPIPPRLRPRFPSPYRRKHIQCRAPPAPHHQGGNRSVGASHAEGSDMLRRRVCAIVPEVQVRKNTKTTTQTTKCEANRKSKEDDKDNNDTHNSEGYATGCAQTEGSANALNDNGAIAARTAFTNRCRRHNDRNEAVRAHIVCTVRIATGATLKSMIQVVGPFASKTMEAGSLERMKLIRCQQPGIDSAC